MKVKGIISSVDSILKENNTFKEQSQLHNINEVKTMDSSNCKTVCNNQCCETKLNCMDLGSIIEFSFDGIYITDGKANTLKVNKSYETITGLKREDLINRNTFDLEKEGVISKSSTLTVLKSRKTNTVLQEFSTGKKALVSSNPIFDNEGNIVMVVTNVRDVTELYQLEEELNKNKEIQEKYYSEIEAMRVQYLNLSDIIVKDKVMLNLFEVAKRVATLDTTILILGETGVGKEEVAKFVHKNSNRNMEKFIRINCGAIPVNLIESELFGYVKGAFTGANKEGKMGLLEVADGGTVFLDEIGELPLDIQVKLLRVLQEGEVERIGDLKPINLDIRVLAATNRNLEDMIKQKTFREDLYYRLNVVPLVIPPLRERREDIVPIARQYIAKLNSKYNFNKVFSAEAMNALYSYDWPGNIRELKNIIERVIVISNKDVIHKSDLPINNCSSSIENNIDLELNCNLTEEVEKVEARFISKAFDKAGNVRDAAKILGIDASTFVRKRKRYLSKGLLQK